MKIVKRFAPLFLAVVLALGSCLSVSAAEIDYDANLPDLQYEYWVIIGNTGAYYLYNTTDMMLYSEYTLTSVTTVKYDFYSSNDAVTWTYHASSTANGQLDKQPNIYASNYDIYDSLGNLVFLAPPLNPVKAVEVLPEVITPQMKIVTITAVSCLALLTSLVMLRKKLPIFLHS